MNNLEIESPEIAKFAGLILDGIASWESAGQLLIKMLSSDPEVFDKIQKFHPEITRSTLLCFQAIGRKTLYPKLLMDQSVGTRKLMEMPYEIQKKYSNEPIDVVVSWGGREIKSIKKKVSDLSKPEVAIVFGQGCVHNLEQQAFRIRNPPKKPKDHATDGKTIDVGYFSISCGEDGKIKLEPCGKTPIAQPVRVIDYGKQWKTAVIVFYKIKE